MKNLPMGCVVDVWVVVTVGWLMGGFCNGCGCFGSCCCNCCCCFDSLYVGGGGRCCRWYGGGCLCNCCGCCCGCCRCWFIVKWWNVIGNELIINDDKEVEFNVTDDGNGVEFVWGWVWGNEFPLFTSSEEFSFATGIVEDDGICEDIVEVEVVLVEKEISM